MEVQAVDNSGVELVGENDPALEPYYTDLEDLQLMVNEDLLDTVDEHIQENLEDDLVKEALEKGVDLREYAKEIEDKLKNVENLSIQDYVVESTRIARLHKQVGASQVVLERMEGMLHGFQHALSSISSEIQSLQVKYSIINLLRLKSGRSDCKLGRYL